MSTNPQEMQLSAEQRQRLVKLSEQTGRPWSELLDDALQNIFVHESDVGERLRRILDEMGRNAASVSEGELDAAMNEALHFVRHQKS